MPHVKEVVFSRFNLKVKKVQSLNCYFGYVDANVKKPYFLAWP